VSPHDIQAAAGTSRRCMQPGRRHPETLGIRAAVGLAAAAPCISAGIQATNSSRCHTAESLQSTGTVGCTAAPSCLHSACRQCLGRACEFCRDVPLVFWHVAASLAVSHSGSKQSFPGCGNALQRVLAEAETLQQYPSAGGGGGGGGCPVPFPTSKQPTNAIVRRRHICACRGPTAPGSLPLYIIP
jgi:hypothetical protein